MKKLKNYSIYLIILFFLFEYVYSFSQCLNSEVISVNNKISKSVYPIGRTVGLKLYTNGVLVVGMSEIEGIDGIYYKPYENTGIKEGDLIKSLNGKELKNVEDLVEQVNNSNGDNISVKYERDSDETYTTIKPVKSIDGIYMIGLWVRDAAAGIGTLTFYDEAENRFATLGHGIEDIDTGKLLNISNGEIVTSKIISIVKGDVNKPGEIRGIIDEGIEVGKIEKNTNLGIYGKTTNFDYINSVKLNEVKVAERNEIQIGKAKIYCQLSNDNNEEFEIEIKKIYKNNSKDNKSMLIKVNDEKLISKTGGIIPRNEWNPNNTKWKTNRCYY